eukprot:TRINITY_DN2015_c0_g1_i1.p1 TRINITY_DN2015_c0_g1~~TRINITY_DN2015_c0_g1_i1.p1  ORF type:complete len:103 (+),score=18.87 TRINITY_DN2015_c0_g1_i1:1-309(+)
MGWGNRIATLPSTIGNLHQLKFLDISCNSLSSLPSQLRYLYNLQWLDFGHNELIAEVMLAPVKNVCAIGTRVIQNNFPYNRSTTALLDGNLVRDKHCSSHVC